MIYVFDIDGTICGKTSGDYKLALPYTDRINAINKLYDNENHIVLYTARGMGRSNNSIEYAIAAFRTLTETQLEKWGVKYHELFFGKPAGDIYIDDKGITDREFFDVLKSIESVPR